MLSISFTVMLYLKSLCIYVTCTIALIKHHPEALEYIRFDAFILEVFLVLAPKICVNLVLDKSPFYPKLQSLSSTLATIILKE